MEDKTLMVSNASPEQQGSFCSTESNHHYINTDAFTAEVAARTAVERGDDALIVDDIEAPDQRVNMLHVQTDNQGLNVTQVKHGPQQAPGR
jgi:hypothetical protein